MQLSAATTTTGEKRLHEPQLDAVEILGHAHHEIASLEAARKLDALVNLLIGNVFRRPVEGLFESMGEMCDLPEPRGLQASDENSA